MTILCNVFLVWMAVVFAFKGVVGIYHYFNEKEWPVVIPEMKVTKGVYLTGCIENTFYAVMFVILLLVI